MAELTEYCNAGDFSASYKDTQTNYAMPLEHYHDSYEIDFFINADMRMFIKDASYLLTNGDVLFINEYDIHRVIHNSNSRYTRYVINFRRRFIEPVLKELGTGSLLDEISQKPCKKVSTSLRQMAEMTHILDELVRLYGRLSVHGEQNMTIALIKAQLFILLYKVKGLLKEASNTVAPVGKEQQVQKIVQFIDANYMHPLSLKVLEKTFNLSKYYICHMFSEVTGFSVFEYIQHRRIIQAQKMLSSTDASVTDICYSTGFSNLQHFYRVFKRISRTTPSQYRKRYRLP